VLRPVPARVARAASAALLLLWAAQMVQLVRRSYLQAIPVTLAADLARYGSGAQWKGVYYRGEKIGFVVSQTLPRAAGGYQLQEDGQLRMSLLGASSAARLRTTVDVDDAFGLQSFAFSLDPGTGPISVAGDLEGRRLKLEVKTASGTRSEVRDLPEAPLLALNLPRRLAAEGLSAGKRLEVSVFDPATLRNARMQVQVRGREVVQAAGRPTPAFRVETSFAGIASTSWVTDLGEVVKEESSMGLVVVKESRERATAMSVPGSVQTDMLAAAAVVPRSKQRIDDPRGVERLRVRLEGVSFPPADLDGAGQTADGDLIEVRDMQQAAPGKADPEADDYLGPEPFLESDDPAIVAEARKAVLGVTGARQMAERLVRHVNAILEKKPTVSLPSAREVLRTRVGDCNEHTALFVAMARALGIPARIAVGLVYLHGAFYYHAWAEVYLSGPGPGKGLWLPADPTLNEFPADATHVRLARGGLDRQAVILPAMGRLGMTLVDVEMKPGYNPVLVGSADGGFGAPDMALPRRDGNAGPTCWSRPARWQ
jgi:Transglutaminase-like superfamily